MGLVDIANQSFCEGCPNQMRPLGIIKRTIMPQIPGCSGIGDHHVKQRALALPAEELVEEESVLGRITPRKNSGVGGRTVHEVLMDLAAVDLPAVSRAQDRDLVDARVAHDHYGPFESQARHRGGDDFGGVGAATANDLPAGPPRIGERTREIEHRAAGAAFAHRGDGGHGRMQAAGKEEADPSLGEQLLLGGRGQPNRNGQRLKKVKSAIGPGRTLVAMLGHRHANCRQGERCGGRDIIAGQTTAAGADDIETALGLEGGDGATEQDLDHRKQLVGGFAADRPGLKEGRAVLDREGAGHQQGEAVAGFFTRHAAVTADSDADGSGVKGHTGMLAASDPPCKPPAPWTGTPTPSGIIHS